MNEYLKAAREGRGWTQSETGQKLGIDDRTYRRWESGKRQPSRPNQDKLCKLFEMTPVAWIYGIEQLEK